MYCSNCGAKAAGNYCSQCGKPLGSAVAETAQMHGPISASHQVDWENELIVANVLQAAQVREAIASNASHAVKGVSAEAFFALYDKIVASPIPTERLAAIIQPLYDSWGIRTGRERVELLHKPIGRVIAQTLCSFAKNSQTLTSSTQIEHGCLLVAELPSSITSLKGTLQVKLVLQGDRTRVEAATIIPGQVFDWGKSNRCLETFFNDLQADLGLPPAAAQAIAQPA